MTASSIRALARVARRDIARHRGRSLLVTLLVLLPVAAMVGGVAVYRTTQPTVEGGDVERMGRADLIAQSISEKDLRAYLPAASVIEPIGFGNGLLIVPGAKPEVTIRALALDGLAHGMLTLLEGRLPHGATEVAITPSVATVAKAGIGGTVTLDAGPPLEIVGLVEDPTYLSQRTVLVDPAASQIGIDVGTWLVGLPEGADAEAIVASTYALATGERTAFIDSRQSSRLSAFGGDSVSSILVLGTLALVEAALIASAAFAVSIRRRQRELGLLAATGATPRQLAGTVVAEAAILGAVAAAGGVVVGIAGAFALTPWLDELTQRRNGPILIDAVGIIGPVLIGLAAALIAAVAPAAAVGRLPVLVALSGRRPPEAPARRTLVLGLAMVAMSLAMTLVGAGIHTGELLPAFLLVGGAILGTLGFGACGPWILERLEGVAVRLPLAGRIAFRDTARARSRSSPIVTAVLASFAATVALGTITVSNADADYGTSSIYPDQIVIQGAGAETAGQEVAKLEGAVAGVAMPKLTVNQPAWFWIEASGARDEDGDPITWGSPGAYVPPTYDTATVATPEVLAMTRAEAAAPALAAGKVVILAEDAMTADSVEIAVQEDPNASEPNRRARYPAEVVVLEVLTGGVYPSVLLPASIAEDMGLEEGPADVYLVRFDHEVTQEDVDRAAEIAARLPDTFAFSRLSLGPPGGLFRMVLIGLALLFALSVTGIAVALGEAEARPEQRSLLALGADPPLRRRIAAARAGVLALLAGLLAVPAGLLPVWGVLLNQQQPLVIPWLEVAGAVVALPSLAIIGGWLLSRPIPEWNAFRNVRPGE